MKRRRRRYDGGGGAIELSYTVVLSFSGWRMTSGEMATTFKLSFLCLLTLALLLLPQHRRLLLLQQLFQYIHSTRFTLNHAFHNKDFGRKSFLYNPVYIFIIKSIYVSIQPCFILVGTSVKLNMVVTVHFRSHVFFYVNHNFT